MRIFRGEGVIGVRVVRWSSINIAEINDRAITHDQAQYLRNKYLWGV